MNLQAVIFDLDGTLVDSAPDIVDLLGEALAESGFPGRRPRTSDIGPPVREMVRNLLIEPTDEACDLIVGLFRDKYDRSSYPNTLPFPGVPALLEALNGSGVELFVATNKPVHSTERILALRFPGVFRAWVCSDSEAPGPRLGKTDQVRRLLSRFGLDPLRTVVIGDGAADILAAKANGCPSVAVTYGYGPQQDLQEAQPDWTASSLDEVAQSLCIPPTMNPQKES